MGALDWVCWIAGGLLGLGGMVLVGRALFADRSRGRRRCPWCWYDMMGVAGLQCPECGREAPSERALFRTRRRKRRVALGVLVALLAGATALLPRLIRDPWGSLPTPVLSVILSFYDDEGDQIFTRLSAALANGKTSRFDRLLLARYCADKLRDPAIAAAPAVNNPAMMGTPTSAAAARAMVMTMRAGGTRAHQLIHMIEQLGQEARPAIPQLVRLLDEKDALAQERAAAALVTLWPGTAELRDAVRRSLNHENHMVRWAAISAIQQRKPPIVELAADLEASVRHATRSTGTAGVDALASLGPASLERLAALLTHSDPTVCLQSAAWIGTFGPGAAAAVPGLTAAAEHQDWRVADSAVRALHRIGPAAAPALPTLERCMATDNVVARATIVQAGEAIGGSDPVTLRILSRGLADPSPAVRRAAANVATRLETAGADLAEELRRAMADEDPEVAEAAAAALEAVTAPAAGGPP